MIAQAWLLKEERFPYKYSATTISCIMATLQCMLIGLYIDRRTASWKLGLNLQLITIFYSGVLATAATFCLIIWAATRKGPTYPLMFNPLSLIVVAIIEAFFFGAPIYLGSLIGMVLIITGLVSFLLGKKMEEIQRSSNPE
ncbi:unnamed protein product [Cuscuta epithymum]|uniref:WAT1-related protein n=1 Tax=Cuscuta epithymum TaxID=186058 RepID=A0AAV0FMK7_9ASTE|nr:unnamed protein product [Cuscuta epithymum]